MSEHNSYDLTMDIFSGKTIDGVQVTRGHGHTKSLDRIAFFFDDKTNAVFETEGDCCSQSWIEHYEIPKDIKGAMVTRITDVQKKEKWDNEDSELTRFYETRFKTTKGEIVLEYRNSSNGYYGGSLRMVSE